jgi:hypothetical protein
MLRKSVQIQNCSQRGRSLFARRGRDLPDRMHTNANRRCLTASTVLLCTHRRLRAPRARRLSPAAWLPGSRRNFPGRRRGREHGHLATRSAPAADLPQEDPATIALGERIEPLLAAYRKAAEDRLKARTNAEAACPAVPDELVCEGPPCGYSVSECDVEGKEILHDVFNMAGTEYRRVPQQILNSEETKAAIARGNLYCNPRTKFGKKVARLIEVAEKYETERAAAIERSGLDDAMAHQFEAAYEIEKLAYEACDIEPQTMAGVLIQARVLTAYAEVEIEVGHYRGRSGQLVGLALAQSLTRLS